MKKILFAALALIVVMASCVKDPQYPGVTITNVAYTPTAVQADMPVTVTATITSFNPVTAKLYYNVNDGAFIGVDMDATAEKDTYTAVIPGESDGAKITFYIEATGSMVATSGTMEYVIGAVAVDYSVIRLNELNGNDKFIELYNAGPEVINLNGVYIVKDGENQNWTGTANVNIEAGGYLVLYSEDVVDPNDPQVAEDYIFHSGLSAKKNVRIQLFTPAGETIDDFNLTNIDLNGEAYGSVEAPASYSLNSDGQWYYSDATPGEANIDGENPVLGLEGGVTPPEPPTPDEPDYTNLVLNELNGDTKFIEFYNNGDQDLSMEGMWFTKDAVEDDIKWTGDATHVVPAHGYLVIYSIDTQADHPELDENMFFNSGLSAKKSVRIALYMPDGTERDVFTRESSASPGEWGATMSNVAPQSYARIPDAGEWMLADPTPGEANPDLGEPIPQE